MSSRTFTVQSPVMTGGDIRAWQETLNRQMATWRVDYRIPEDGVYGVRTRDLTGSVAHGMGLASAAEAMKDGVTPELRVKLRNKNLTPTEVIRFHSPGRAAWRAAFRARHAGGGVAPPLNKILQHSWGYHPPVHDGVDLICLPDAAIFAMCAAEVIRADTSGWWGKGAPTDPAVRGKGDGIIIIRCLTVVGPFRPGLNLCYGHAEKPSVREGEVVKAGEKLGHAGFANAWHVHFMVNDNSNDRGVGDRDPWPYVDYSITHA
jgi:murein DD-endopeptidase MepM/ murein hydrolase activator NlpD